MYVTIQYVKCKTKKCGETIALDKPFQAGETRELKCSRAHENKYDSSAVRIRNVRA